MTSLSQSKYRSTPQGSETEQKYEGSLSAKARKRKWWRNHKSPKSWDPKVGSLVRIIRGPEMGTLWQVVGLGSRGVMAEIKRGSRLILVAVRDLERV